MASEVTQRQRAEAEVEKLLEFIEATAGRKLRFRPICNLNTGKQESPSERLAGWYEKIVATARQEALRDVQDEIERFIDYSGGCVGTKNNLEVVAVNRFIELTVRPLLDRLAREGVR